MHPFEILKLTPKTNCGQCGHPTCLAFAAAVAKTGEPAAKCPFIDQTAIAVTIPPAVNTLDDLPQQHDLALIEHLKEKIARLDFAAIAPGLGADWRADKPDSLFLVYLGQAIEISKDGIRMAGGEPSDPRDQILLYNYVHSGGGSPPDQTWVGMESLPNSISKVKTLARYCEERLAVCLDGLNAEKITAITRELGATSQLDPSADLVLTVPVLPRIPERIIFRKAEPEEGFPATVKVLFDHRVLDFLDLESLVFTAERMAERIAELADQP